MSDVGDKREWDIRKGPGVSWRMVTTHSIIQGYTVDNLDKKDMNEARDRFERIFVSIRGVLEQHESRCLDNEEERLQVCQEISQHINKNYRQIFQK